MTQDMDVTANKFIELAEKAIVEQRSDVEVVKCDDDLFMLCTKGDTICFGDPNHHDPVDSAPLTFLAHAWRQAPALARAYLALREQLEIAHASGSAMAEEADRKTALARTLAVALGAMLTFDGGEGSVGWDAGHFLVARKNAQGALAEARAAGLLPEKEGENG